MTFTTFLTRRDETADAVTDFQAHPDLCVAIISSVRRDPLTLRPRSRTIASFTLGWVFLLACRQLIHAPFTHTLGRALCTIFLPDHQRPADVESTLKPLSLHANLGSSAEVESGLEIAIGSSMQRFLTFLMYWALIVSSMAQFLSLLVFGNGLSYESLCGA